MKHLKKTPVILLLTLLTVIIGSWTVAPALFGTSGGNTQGLTSSAANPATTGHVKTEATNIIFQSKDGGLTWEDISTGLPQLEQLEGFFAGASEIYLRTNGVLYVSGSSLPTPVWEKENIPFLESTSMAFNRSGVMTYSNDGYIYQKQSASETWLPIYTNLRTHTVQTIFEASDGSVFLSTGRSLSKSTDQARSWKLVQKGGVADIVESDGVLLAAGQNGIMRSTDKGEHWEWVISEGGVGIAVERINGGLVAISYNTTLEARRIHLSLDNGKTWKAIDEGLRPSSFISSVKQIGKYLVCAHPDGIFRSSDMGKSWILVHSGVEPYKLQLGSMLNNERLTKPGKVFELHVSGSVLYAVARNWGC